MEVCSYEKTIEIEIDFIESILLRRGASLFDKIVDEGPLEESLDCTLSLSEGCNCFQREDKKCHVKLSRKYYNELIVRGKTEFKEGDYFFMINYSQKEIQRA